MVEEHAIISKEDFEKVFNNKNIVKKEEILQYYDMKK